jgi:hypothetical protein
MSGSTVCSPAGADADADADAEKEATVPTRIAGAAATAAFLLQPHIPLM